MVMQTKRRLPGLQTELSGCRSRPDRTAPINTNDLKVVIKRPTSTEELKDLLFAWKVA